MMTTKSLVAQFLTCFVATHNGQIDVDFSQHPPFGLLYRELFYVTDREGKVVASYRPDQRRIAMVFVALMLFFVETRFAVNDDGEMILNADCIPENFAVASPSQEPIFYRYQDVVHSDSPYKSHYKSSLHELTTIYRKLERFLCHFQM
jgi:hypothetical protein